MDITIYTYFVYLSMKSVPLMSPSQLDYVKDFTIDGNIVPLAKQKTAARKTIIRSNSYS